MNADHQGADHGLSADPHPHTEDRLSPKLRQVLVLGVLAAAIVLFFAGLETPRERAGRAADQLQALQTPGDDHSAPRLGGDQPPRELSRNAGWTSKLPPLPMAVIQPPTDPNLRYPQGLTPEEEASWQQALERRRAIRAYDGAPPRIPHAIDQISTASCLACHEHGFDLGSVAAPKMSHAPLAQCTQCHVEGGPTGGAPGIAFVLSQNSFQGLASYGKGTRAYPGAPPTMPHPMAMREDCMSCHGSLGQDMLRVTHPWRANCVQCHAADAEISLQGYLKARETQR